MISRESEIDRWRAEAHRLFPTGPSGPEVLQYASDRLAKVEAERAAVLRATIAKPISRSLAGINWIGFTDEELNELRGVVQQDDQNIARWSPSNPQRADVLKGPLRPEMRVENRESRRPQEETDV